MTVIDKKSIAEFLNEFIPEISQEEIESYIEIPPGDMDFNYSFPCFKLAKIEKKAPNVIAEDLMKKAEQLPKNSVIIYDEGRSGLDSASAMTAINKTMSEFFQRCRVYHHVIIIVLPNFFKLHEDYAVARSQFLIDTYADEKFNRGYFSF